MQFCSAWLWYTVSVDEGGSRRSVIRESGDGKGQQEVI